MPLLSKPLEPDSKAYYLKLLFLVADVGRSVLQDVFDRKISPAKLPGVLAKSKIRKKLRKLQSMKILYQYQMDALYPSSGIVKSADFDVSLLIVLLRNICNITTSPDDTVWKRKPLPTDKSVAADIVRMKEMRNDLCHRTNLTLKESDFDNTWDEIKDALVRLGGKTKYEEDIDNIKESSPDPEMEEYYRQLLKDKEEEDTITKEKIYNLEKKLEDNTRELQELKERNAEAEINIRTKFRLLCAGAVVGMGWYAGCTYFLNRYEDDPEAVKALVQQAIISIASFAMGATVVDIFRGSIIIKVKVTSLQALNYLWKSCGDGEMEKNLHNVIVTDGLMKEAPPGTDGVRLSVTISEEEYQTARQILLNSCQSSIQSHGKRDSEHLDLEEREPPRKRMRCDETSLSSTDNCNKQHGIPKGGANGDDAQTISAGSRDPDVLTENACPSSITDSSPSKIPLREIDKDDENSYNGEKIDQNSTSSMFMKFLQVISKHQHLSIGELVSILEKSRTNRETEMSSTKNCIEQFWNPDRGVTDADPLYTMARTPDVRPSFFCPCAFYSYDFRDVHEDDENSHGKVNFDQTPTSSICRRFTSKHQHLSVGQFASILEKLRTDRETEMSSTKNCIEQHGNPERELIDADPLNTMARTPDGDARPSSFGPCASYSYDFRDGREDDENSCGDGEMEKNLHNVIVTDGLMIEVPPGTDSVWMSVTMSEEEIQTARQILMNSCQSSIQSHGKRDSEHLDLKERQPPRKRMICNETSLSSTDNCHPKEGVNGDNAQTISAGSLDPDVLKENACPSSITDSSASKFPFREIDKDDENSHDEEKIDPHPTMQSELEHQDLSLIKELRTYRETEMSSTKNCIEQHGEPERGLIDADPLYTMARTPDGDARPSSFGPCASYSYDFRDVHEDDENRHGEENFDQTPTCSICRRCKGTLDILDRPLDVDARPKSWRHLARELGIDLESIWLREIFKQEWDASYAAKHGQWDDTPASYTAFENMESPRNRSRNKRLLGLMSTGDAKNRKNHPTEDPATICEELQKNVEELKNAENVLEDKKKPNAKPNSFCVLLPHPSHDKILDRKKEVKEADEIKERCI